VVFSSFFSSPSLLSFTFTYTLLTEFSIKMRCTFSILATLSAMSFVAAQNPQPDKTQQLSSTAGIPDNTDGE